jgi:hypothetical protein
VFWRRSKPKQIALTPERKNPPSPAPEVDITDAILAYQRSFSESLKQALNSDTEEAKRNVARAHRIVGDSGLGPALAPTLLEEIKYWPSWCQREDFQQHVKFPASDISGSTETDPNNETKTSRIHFSYAGNPYRLIFVDQGMSRWASDDPCARGKVELIYRGHSVLGLDISQDLSKEHYQWRWNAVFAFLTGSWMKDLIEMAAIIEDGQRRLFDDYLEKDALDRASRIKL